MELKRKVIMAAFGLLAAGMAASSAFSDTRFEANHPRQDQVLDRVAHQRQEVRHERREGDISSLKAHRLMVHENRIARQDHRFARHHGGAISRHEQMRLNHQENRTQRRIEG